MRPTKRQFIEWSPAVLAAEISKAPRRYNISFYLSCRPMPPTTQSDKMFIDRIKLLIDTSTDFWWILIDMEKKLPLWMSTEILEILVPKVGVETLVPFVRSVDNLLFLLRGIDDSKHKLANDIAWDFIWPLSRLRELLPWYSESVAAGNICNARRIIMGTTEVYPMVQYFRDIKQVIKYAVMSSPGLWAPFPHGYSTIKGLNKRYLEQILDMGWIVSYHFGAGFINLEELILSVLMEKKLSYFLFDENYSHGHVNRRLSKIPNQKINEMVAADIKADPARYAIWRGLVEEQRL